MDYSGNELIRKIENQIGRYSYRFKTLKNLTKIQTIIRNKVGYQIYRVFIGFDTDWNVGKDWQKARNERETKINKIIQDIKDINFNDWREKFLSIVKGYPKYESGEYNYFRYFLRKLGEEKPSFALKLLKQNQKELHSFITDLVVGIWFSNLNNEARKIISKWSKYKSKINICADVFSFNDVFDFSLVKNILIKATEIENRIVVKKSIGSFIRNYENDLNFKRSVLFGISKLSLVNDSGWVDYVWYQDRKKYFFDSLNSRDISKILRNLLVSPRIDYNHESILKYIAQKEPIRLIKFFEERIKYGIDQVNKIRNYEAIPYEFHELNNPLQENQEIVFIEILSWFRKRHWKFKHEAGHIIKKIFPDLTPKFEKTLIKYIKTQDPNVPKVVFNILESYEGQRFLHKICKEFIKIYGGLKNYKQRMFSALSRTGIVCGEDGFVRAYEEKKRQIQVLNKDKNGKVRTFAQEYESYLSNEIQREEKRADENLNLFKRGIR